MVTSSGPATNDAVLFTVTTADNVSPCGGSEACDSASAVRTQGALHVYQAQPYTGTGGTPSLQEAWNSTGSQCQNCQTFCAAPFALPTVAKGRVYLPTYAINNDGTTNCPDQAPANSYLSGIVVYGPN